MKNVYSLIAGKFDIVGRKVRYKENRTDKYSSKKRYFHKML